MGERTTDGLSASSELRSGVRKRLSVTARIFAIAVGVAAIVAAALCLRGRPSATAAERLTAGRFPEQIVYVRTKDDIVDAGALVAPPTESAQHMAVIWIHGWGANFYSPTYVAIARALSNRGYPTIVGNTRMHDIGNVEAWRGGKRIRGGGYWGIASEEVRDVAAWVDFAERIGFKRIVLVGHSAGWAAVRGYQAQADDPRVSGVVLASGEVRADMDSPDQEEVGQAEQMIEQGNPDDLVRIRGRSFPSFVSAATFMDNVRSSPEMRDFFGVQTANPGIARIHCPLLAFFGTNGDVGGESDLKLIESSIKRQPTGPIQVTTEMIRGADHEYAGKEDQVADLIVRWMGQLPHGR